MPVQGQKAASSQEWPVAAIFSVTILRYSRDVQRPVDISATRRAMVSAEAMPSSASMEEGEERRRLMPF